MTSYNPPAFPSQEGMSLRDYFAGQAITGLVTNVNEDHKFFAKPEEAALFAYEIADYLLDTRDQWARTIK